MLRAGSAWPTEVQKEGPGTGLPNLETCPSCLSPTPALWAQWKVFSALPETAKGQGKAAEAMALLLAAPKA